jgi:BirA family biotin operon repressor/biotin-[acetyl-CoA-carboxylase] ligase
LAQNAENTFPKWLHYFDTINSTNNYAMRLVDDGMAQHGTVVRANHQTEGKGQRGKKWANSADNIMMSLVLKPEISPERQFGLSMAVALTLANYLQTIFGQWQVAIKWPNDIYINDKKTCGILIENIFRGMNWAFAIAGIGVNVNQEEFPEELPNATSLYLESGQRFDLQEMVTDIRTGILNNLRQLDDKAFPELLRRYNQLLFRKNKEVHFADRSNNRNFEAFVQEVNADGRLVLLTHKGIEHFQFGQLEWIL